MLDDLFSLSQTFLRIRNRDFRRYFLRDTPLANRFSIIVGPRGVGKTTVMTQHLLEICAGDRFSRRALYVQADHFLVARSSLYEIADEFRKSGGEFICFDEIHKYPDWSMELKSINDTFPDLRILASGSSTLEITRGSHDLSRRAVVHRMHGMSLREYLGMAHGLFFERLPLEEILFSHTRAAAVIVAEIESRGLRILPLFADYLACGYYPYFLEFRDRATFYITLEQNIRTTLENDLLAVHPSLNGTSIRRIEKLLSVIASLVPFTPDMRHLKNLLEIGDERTLKTYLKYLEDAGIILTAGKSGRGLRGMEKPEKIYLSNPNLFHAMVSQGRSPDVGAMRETFFLTMLRINHRVTVPPKGDFLVDDARLFEIGGKNKDSGQLKDNANAWRALDGIETGQGSRIPLWLFGFLY